MKDKKRMSLYFNLDFYYSILRRDWQFATIITDILLKLVAVLVVSINRFIKDACSISASALTFYSLLAFIPVLALALGIARGFGVSKILENEIRQQAFTDPAVTDWVVQFANKALENTKGGMITGVGIVLLIWSVVKMLGSTELAMNRIWGVKKGRSFVKQATNYLSIMFIVPILMILASSMNVYLTSNIENFITEEGFLSYAGTAMGFLLNLVPYVLVWLLFIFMYMYVPATPVKFKYALVSGIVAGTVFQVVQWFYIRFQIGVSSYNAIYGSLAALPLLLVWLQLSWSIVLWGTELCYILRNRHFLFRSALDADDKWVDSIETSLRVIKYIASEFVQGKGGPTLAMISKKLRMSTSKLCVVLEDLVEKRLLVEVDVEDDTSYFPAKDLHDLSYADVIILLSDLDNNKGEEWKIRLSTAVRKEFATERFA